MTKQLLLPAFVTSASVSWLQLTFMACSYIPEKNNLELDIHSFKKTQLSQIPLQDCSLSIFFQHPPTCPLKMTRIWA